VRISKEDELQPGYVYFINTQLLGKDKLLTKEGGGDLRNTTFWQTVARTIARAPQDFVLIIDEAHRGATATDRNRTTSCRSSSSARRWMECRLCVGAGHERHAAAVHHAAGQHQPNTTAHQH